MGKFYSKPYLLKPAAMSSTDGKQQQQQHPALWQRYPAPTAAVEMAVAVENTSGVPGEASIQGDGGSIE